MNPQLIGLICAAAFLAWTIEMVRGGREVWKEIITIETKHDRKVLLMFVLTWIGLGAAATLLWS